MQGMSGNKFKPNKKWEITISVIIPYLSNPKPEHTPGGTVRGGPGGTAAPGGDGQHRTPTTGLLAKETTNPLIRRRWKNDLLCVPLEAQTREILPVESKTRTHNGRVRSARPTAHGWGRAKLVRIGCRDFGRFGSQASL